MKPILRLSVSIFMLSVLLLPMLQLTGCNSGRLFRRSQYIMGTIVDVTVVAANRSDADAAINGAFKEIQRLDRLFSIYSDDSEISAINRNAGKRPVAVSGDTIELVEKGIEVSRLTGGAFDIALGPAISVWNIPGTPSGSGAVPAEKSLERVRDASSYRHIEIDKLNQTVYLDSSQASIDPGGIAKGYAADHAVMVLKKSGISAGMVAVAGDIRAFGRKPNGSFWKIGIRSPRGNGLLKRIELDNQAVSTSGDYERYFEKNGVRYHHIIDPVTLKPARKTISVTVVSRSGYLSDAVATGLFVAGAEKTMDILKRLPRISVIMVDADGALHEFE